MPLVRLTFVRRVVEAADGVVDGVEERAAVIHRECGGRGDRERFGVLSDRLRPNRCTHERCSPRRHPKFDRVALCALRCSASLARLMQNEPANMWTPPRMEDESVRRSVIASQASRVKAALAEQSEQQASAARRRMRLWAGGLLLVLLLFGGLRVVKGTTRGPTLRSLAATEAAIPLTAAAASARVIDYGENGTVEIL